MAVPTEGPGDDDEYAHGALADIEAANPFLGNHLGFDNMPAVTAATIVDRTVEVEFEDGSTHHFHHQWLRHACYCEHCGNPADGIRFSTVVDFDSSITPAEAEAVAGELHLRWPDEHTSRFGNDWLLHHAYDGRAARRRSAWAPTTWRADLATSFPTVSWSEAADKREGRLRAYQLLRDYGIVQIDELGIHPERTEQLAALLGPIHVTTVYGRIYDVRAEPVAKLGAKTGMAQAVHIDDAFYYSPPGIDVFHCLLNTETGGMSTYVDGFAIAASIAAEDPASYELLTTIPIAHIRRHPDEIDLRSRGPLITLDNLGHPAGIRYFDRAMAPLDCDLELIEPMYDAIRAFNKRMKDPAFVAEIRVPSGNGMLIDNHRVMHGRTAFDPSSGRHIRLCHVPRDEFHGRYRELSRHLDPAQHDLHLPAGAGSA